MPRRLQLFLWRHVKKHWYGVPHHTSILGINILLRKFENRGFVKRQSRLNQYLDLRPFCSSRFEDVLLAEISTALLPAWGTQRGCHDSLPRLD